jgi:hypothetical protein
MEKSILVNLLLSVILISTYGCKKDDFSPKIDDFDPYTMGDYFVSPSGNDNNPGTFDKPWATWQKAADEARAGDTVYFRGGTWYVAGVKSVAIFRYDGRKDEPICFFNYPGEEPIIDGNLRNPTDWNTCFTLNANDYISFKGITIRNFRQPSAEPYNAAWGIGASDCTNLTFENMTIHDIGGGGIRHLGAWKHPGYKPYTYPEHEFMTGDISRFINCDVYNCNDNLGSMPGNMADGFKVDNEIGSIMYFEGCRAWNCSDDGFDISGHVLGVINKCWAFEIGKQELQYANGNGFKLGPGRRYNEHESAIIRIVTNCIAANNRSAGFTENNGIADDPDTPLQMYNNLCYGNDRGFVGNWDHTYDHEQIYKNNIIFASKEIGGKDSYSLNSYLHSNNSWDSNLTLTVGDFASKFNIQELKNPRTNGSLPNIKCLRLAENSDLKSAGTNVGMTESPDMGIDWEYLDNQ